MAPEEIQKMIHFLSENTDYKVITKTEFDVFTKQDRDSKPFARDLSTPGTKEAKIEFSTPDPIIH